MLNVGKNRHRWKAWVDDHVRHVLERAAEHLKWSWREDNKSPRAFPLQTWWVFVQVKEELAGGPARRTGIKLRRHQPPKKLSDLLREGTVKVAYEDHNQGTYEDALKQADLGYDEGYSAWRKIKRALDVAYIILYYGAEFAPRPRVNFLHRELLGIADSDEGLRDQDLAGLAEFLDDICPCGRKHQPDAIRKLRGRLAHSGSKSRPRP